jgi:hypothetical protein
MTCEPFVIRNSQGGDMITVSQDGPNITLATHPRRKGDPVTITAAEARDLADALIRRSPKVPMIGPYSGA